MRFQAKHPESHIYNDTTIQLYHTFPSLIKFYCMRYTVRSIGYRKKATSIYTRATKSRLFYANQLFECTFHLLILRMHSVLSIFHVGHASNNFNHFEAKPLQVFRLLPSCTVNFSEILSIGSFSRVTNLLIGKRHEFLDRFRGQVLHVRDLIGRKNLRTLAR